METQDHCQLRDRYLDRRVLADVSNQSPMPRRKLEERMFPYSSQELYEAVKRLIDSGKIKLRIIGSEQFYEAAQ